ncbi:MAG: putative quinol monooxygenase [Hyphomonas sp.]
MIIVTGHAITSPGTAERMRPPCVAHSVRSRAEPGCIAHNLHVDCEDASRLVFVAYWVDIGALKAHLALPESLQFVRTLRALSPATGAMQICPVTETAP